MTLIVFLIDNSASMNQRTYLGTTLLDIAKSTVESFFKIRMGKSRVDRYFVLTLEKEPHHVKMAGWKQNSDMHCLHAALESIKADGLTSLGAGLRRTFDMLNLNRAQLGYETYGMGRYPNQLEPAIVLCITDGRRLTTEDGVVSGGLNLPMLDQGVPGHEYTSQPFRWDYRLYALVLRYPAVRDPNLETPKFIPTDDESPINSMCEVTGGRAYKILNGRMLQQCIESLAQKCQPGVVVHFMKLSEGEMPKDNPPKWHSCKKMIYVKMTARMGTANSNWPIPEAFWPDEVVFKGGKLPPRSAHPLICFSCVKHRQPKVLEYFPIDRYELEPSPLTQYILEKRDSNFVWQCYVPHSGRMQDHPFGYLKASSDLQSVNLHVLPYNYPVLMDLLVELAETHKMRMNDVWANPFFAYLTNIPKYYYMPLTKAFERLGFQGIIKSDAIELVLPYEIKVALQRQRQQAKMEYDRFVKQVESQEPQDEKIQVPTTTSFIQRSDFNQMLLACGNNLANVNSLQQHQRQLATMDMRPVTLARCIRRYHPYEQPCDIPRHALRQMLPKMRSNLLAILENRGRPMEREYIHQQPMAEMGDYINYKFSVSGPPPLRELNPAPERADTFGNPFRKKASSAFVADEGFVDEMGMAAMAVPDSGQMHRRRHASSASSTSSQGRAKGPLPLDITVDNWRKSQPPSPVPSPDSPIPSYYKEDFADSASMEVNGDDAAPSRMLNGITSLSATESRLPKATHSHPGPGEMKRSKALSTKQAFVCNSAIINALIQSVREPMIDGSDIFERLAGLTGSLKQRLSAVAALLAEAQRFKRQRLVLLLSNLRVHLESSGRPQSSEPTGLVNGQV